MQHRAARRRVHRDADEDEKRTGDGNASDHPGNEGNGPSWVASIVNAIGTSQIRGFPGGRSLRLLRLQSAPLQFQTIAAPLKAEYFQNDKTPVKDPDDD